MTSSIIGIAMIQPVPICLARPRLNVLLLLHPTKCENLEKKGQFEHSDGLFFLISRTKREEPRTNYEISTGLGIAVRQRLLTKE